MGRARWICWPNSDHGDDKTLTPSGMAIPRAPALRQRLRWLSFVAIAGMVFVVWIPLAQAKVRSEYFIHELPGAPLPLLKMWAGHVELNSETNANMFFWFFQNRHIANRQRTVIWINGGPGCSSMDGALMEIGPYRVNENGTLRIQDGAWDEFANLLFVDNPVGTGFSYVNSNAYVHELDEMAKQFVNFLEKWFTLFSEYLHDDLYIAGESYAGQHIPYIAQEILTRKQGWNLRGIMIGNGWISGPDHYKSYIPFARQEGLLKPGSEAETIALRQEQLCFKELENGAKDHVDNRACENIMQEIMRNTQNNGDCLNMYDVRLRDSYPSCGMNWPEDLTQLTPYLRRDDVTKALHVNPDKNQGWVECNGQVSATFTARDSKPSRYLLPGILSRIPIVLFSGDKDLICNHLGTESIINGMEWNGGAGMEESPGVQAPVLDWVFDGEPAGTYQTARNLTYVRFYNSSHMVPYDYPRRTRDMLDRFVGVDIQAIGGTPVDSQVGGEDGAQTSVGGLPNSDTAQAEKLQLATWAAYRRSGTFALVIVLIAACAWGYFVWRDRRRRAGYRGVFGADPHEDILPRMNGRGSHAKPDRDLEDARDFNEAELDDMEPAAHDRHADRFELGDDEDEHDERVR